MARHGSFDAGDRRLVDAARADSTRIKYHLAVEAFLSWCGDHGLLKNAARGVADLDALLNKYFVFLWTTRRGGKGVASATLHGVRALFPAWRDLFPIATEAVRGFNRVQPGRQYPPITWPLCCALAVHLVSSGCTRVAVGLLAGFHCMLRSGELCRLRTDDLAFPSDPRVGGQLAAGVLAAFRLGRTKTGANQWAEVTSPALAGLLRAVSRSTPPGAKLFGASPAIFRKLFRAACKALGLDSKYTPHSLRHGGATALFMSGMSISDIMVRGRWGKDKTARHYIQTGPALLLARRVPANVAEAGAVFASDLGRFMALAQRR
jgi:integrase